MYPLPSQMSFKIFTFHEKMNNLLFSGSKQKELAKITTEQLEKENFRNKAKVT